MRTFFNECILLIRESHLFVQDTQKAGGEFCVLGVVGLGLPIDHGSKVAVGGSSHWNSTVPTP